MSNGKQDPKGKKKKKSKSLSQTASEMWRDFKGGWSQFVYEPTKKDIKKFVHKEFKNSPFDKDVQKWNKGGKINIKASDRRQHD